MMQLRRTTRRAAFTLFEALLAIAILAMAITAVTMPFSAGAQNEQVDARRSLAVNFAQELMEEILAKPFYDPQSPDVLDPGPETGESGRDGFDNVDDYHGYTEEPGDITGFSGAVLEGPAAYGLSRHATAEYVYVSGQDTDNPPTFIRVVVEIRYQDQPTVTLSRLIYAMQ